MANLRAGLGEAIRARRHRRGLSQEHLAELAELDRTYVSGVERGTRNPALSTLEKLAGALGVRVSELVRDAERRAGIRRR